MKECYHTGCNKPAKKKLKTQDKLKIYLCQEHYKEWTR